MVALIEFTGKKPLTGPPPADGFELWTYTVDPGSTPAAFVGKRIALGFPHDLNVQDPTTFSGIPELTGMSLSREAGASRQYVGRDVTTPGKLTLSLVSAKSTSPAELLLVVAKPGDPWEATPFGTTKTPVPELVQMLPAPAATEIPLSSLKPPSAFQGVLPYASELFGVYQPLAGWLGRRTLENMTQIRIPENVREDQRGLLAERINWMRGREGGELALERFSDQAARMAEEPLFRAALQEYQDASRAVLSPVGLVTLFCEYFFEFDNFLGVPSGHLWISPGGTVEVVESSTRRTLVERTAEDSEERTYKVEETLTDQDDLADAVKEDNANDTKLGASASGGVNFAGIYHGDASASFSNQATTKKRSQRRSAPPP